MKLIDILRSALAAVRAIGPYALLELLMPGGTILAIALYLYRRRMNTGAGASQPAEFPSCSS